LIHFKVLVTLVACLSEKTPTTRNTQLLRLGNFFHTEDKYCAGISYDVR
jgi:hypothetical protein